MPDRILEALDQAQSPNDLRFQFDVIKGLAESVRSQTAVLMRLQEQQTDIVARLERIEAKETAEQVAALKARVEALEKTEHRREGASAVITAILKSPVIGWAVGAGSAIWAVATGRLHL